MQDSSVQLLAQKAGKHLEPGALACSRLLLHRHDLHDLILEGALQEGLHNLVLLHGEGEQENLLQTFDLPLQYTVMRVSIPTSSFPGWYWGPILLQGRSMWANRGVYQISSIGHAFSSVSAAHLLHESPKLSAGHPLLFIVLLPARSPGSSATTSIATSTITPGGTAVCHNLHIGTKPGERQFTGQAAFPCPTFLQA